MYLLGAWTLVEAYSIGVVCASYAAAGMGAVVVQAAGLTACVFLGLTAFTMQSKYDFSMLGASLYSCLNVLICWSILNWIFGVQSTLMALFGAILFSVYIVYDTFMIMNKIGCDDYILASINLYLDIVNLFLYILQLLSSDRRN